MIIGTYLKRVFSAFFLLAISCVEPFTPKVAQENLNILVVDGFVNATDRSATVRLSRSQPISELETADPETKATVIINASTGNSYSLLEKNLGEYKLKDLVIDKTALYTLRITTASGREYVSDTISIKATPPVDSLGFSISSNGEILSVHVNTHDSERKTRYYGWDYIETYQYYASDSSQYKFVKKVPLPRTAEESIFSCWQNEDPTSISIGTSIRLADDVINRKSILSIPKGSPKISIRYSVLVKQRALTLLEYTYLDDLRKTTESLGGIFGTTPITVLGNIHSITDKNEPVLGFFSGAEIKEKRFFIEYLDMPPEFRTLRDVGCNTELSCPIFPDPTAGPPLFCVSLNELPDNTIILRLLDQNFYEFTTPECGDCRIQGGTTKRPDFW
jgi:hypothetical protein